MAKDYLINLKDYKIVKGYFPTIGKYKLECNIKTFQDLQKSIFCKNQKKQEMKTLYMVRHAKSSWKHDVDDHKRPLKTRGENDGNLVSKKASSEIEPPQKIISSDATRALTTAQFFKEAWNIDDAHFETDHALYDFSGQDVIRIIKSLDNELERAMIVGHNHAFTSVVNMLGNKYIENVPTCGFVVLEFDENNWKDITTGRTVKTIFPRDLK